jgi:hypothetical protein
LAGLGGLISPQIVLPSFTRSREKITLQKGVHIRVLVRFPGTPPSAPEFRHGKAYKSVLQRHGKCSVCLKYCVLAIFPKNVPEMGAFCN